MGFSRIIVSLAISAVFYQVSAFAGDGNTLLLKQESPDGSIIGNRIEVDQSRAQNSHIGGISRTNALVAGADINLLQDSSTLAAGQRGEGNVTRIEMEGSGGLLMLIQDTSPLTPMQLPNSGTSNHAYIDFRGDNTLGAVVQLGSGNIADLELLQNNTRGLINQIGSDLTANLTVQGRDSSGVINQIGSRNTANVEVTGVGTNVNYTQIGNGLNSVVPAEVFSTNPGNIVITQTGF